MASNSEFIIKCKTQNGSLVIKSVNSESTVKELKMHLSSKINLKPEFIKILCGYPPKALNDESDDLKLKDVNIFSGETIIVEKKNVVESDVKRSDASSVSSGDAVSERKDGDAASERKDGDAASERKDGDAASERKDGDAVSERKDGDAVSERKDGDAVSERKDAELKPGAANPSIGVEDFCSEGIMMRHVVPSNNSCLFASVYFVLSNGDLNQEKSTELRNIIARVVSQNPEKFTAAFLGMPNADYCAWIQNTDHWGGAIELSILSEHFRIEIVAVDTINLTMHRFGENEDYNNRIFLIYDGIHYDPLILELDSAPMQTIFPVSDERPMEMAMEIAREAKSSRQYTDMANFTLRCFICDLRLRGDKEAREHARTTGHLEFGEILQ